MNRVLQLQLVRCLTWFLARLAPEPTVFAQQLETSMRALNALYGTTAVHMYLDGREAYLKEMIVQAVIEHKDVQADKAAGALHEIRNFKDKLKAAHAYCERLKTLTQAGK